MVTVVTPTHSDKKEESGRTGTGGDGLLPTLSPIDPHLAGQQLSRAREEKSWTIADVAQKTHIRQQYLLSMERGDIESLPGHVYAVGFVKTYATCLGLDPDELLERFGLRRDIEADYSTPTHATVPPSQQQKPSRLIIRLSILLTLLLVAGLLIGQNWGRVGAPAQDAYVQSDATHQKSFPMDEGALIRAGEGGKALEDSLVREPTRASSGVGSEDLLPENTVLHQSNRVITDAADTGALNTPAVTHTEKAHKNGAVSAAALVPLEVVATQLAWVQILDQDQKIIFVQLMNPGDRYTVPAGKNGLFLTTGNAGGVHLARGERVTEALGQPGQVLRGVSIDHEKQQLQDSE